MSIERLFAEKIFSKRPVPLINGPVPAAVCRQNQREKPFTSKSKEKILLNTKPVKNNSNLYGAAPKLSSKSAKPIRASNESEILNNQSRQLDLLKFQPFLGEIMSNQELVELLQYIMIERRLLIKIAENNFKF